MTVSLGQFVQHLTASGLLSAAEVDSFQASLPPDRRPTDAESLARELVRANRLTKYQAQVVYQGKTKGLVFGEYRVLDKLGQGGMGVVLKAEHRRMKRLVAVKMIAGAAMRSPDAAKRFYREVEAAARLVHPNIVTAHDASEHEGVHYLVMQYVDGKDLSALVRKQGPLPLRQAAEYVMQAARGLEYAHNQGIVHRDIKPSNLLVDQEGTVKILDMGIARIGGEVEEDDKDRLTASGAVMGTCDFMAPEQAFDTHSADGRADIYSLGCTLYWLVTGKSPYRGETLVQILMAHREAPIPSLRKARSDVPEDLDAMFQKMVAKSPQDRYQSMAEVVSALEGFLFWAKDELSLTGARTPSAAGDAISLQDSVPNNATVVVRKRPTNKRKGTSGRGPKEASVFRDGLESFLGSGPRKKAILVAFALGWLGIAALIYRGATVQVDHSGEKETMAAAGEASKAQPKAEGGQGKGEGGGQPGAIPIPNPQSLIPSTPPPPLAIAPFDAKKAKEHQEVWAKHLEVPVETTNSLGMKFALIPPGEFMMGSPKELIEEESKVDYQWYKDRLPDETPQHRVRITKAFYLGAAEVTQEQYQRIMGVNPSAFSASGKGKEKAKIVGVDTKRLPVEQMTWSEAVEFCRRLSEMPEEKAAGRSYRLPSEAQWEYACRAGSSGRYDFSSGFKAGLRDSEQRELMNHEWFLQTSQGRPHAAGEKPANAWGLYDMQGNVAELCQDGFDPAYYAKSPKDDPINPPTARNAYISRGGSWGGPAWYCRAAHRCPFSEGPRFSFVGFRVALILADKPPGQAKRPAATTGPAGASGSSGPAIAIAPFDAKTAREHQEAWAKRLGVPVESTNSLGMKLALIPPGEFDMGSSPADIAAELERAKNNQESKAYQDLVLTEGPRHRVRITKPFYFGMCAVTQGEYEKVMGANPSHFTAKHENLLGKDTSRHPVETVSWEDAMDFCRRLSAIPAEQAVRRVYRLPTEAEFEYACRAGTVTRWYCGDDEAGVLEVAWCIKNANGTTHPVAEKRPNAWGLYDMHGNVWQWCMDKYRPAYYQQSSSSDGALPPAGPTHVFRGGFWTGTPSTCRSSYRNSALPASRTPSIGFRVVADIDATAEGTPDCSASPIPDPQFPPPSAAVAPEANKAKALQQSWAKQHGIPVEQINSLGMKLALIPPGEFDMGSPKEVIEEESKIDHPWYREHVVGEGPQHRVRITKPFYLGTAEVTQEEYQRLMGVNPSAFSTTGEKKAQTAGQDTKRFPVERVAWDEAVEFCRKLSGVPEEKAAGRSYHLPSEAQWEYACRAGSTGRFNFCWAPKRLSKEAEERDLTGYEWFELNSEGRPHAAGEKPANAWGLHDMHGSVIEWCQDYFDRGRYAKSSTDNPINLQRTPLGRVGRGGSWGSPARMCRSAFRFSFSPRERFDYVGFRVAMVLPDKPK